MLRKSKLLILTLLTLLTTVSLSAQPISVAYEATVEPGQIYLFGDQKLQHADVGVYYANRAIPRIGASGDSTIYLTLHVCADIEVSYEATIKTGEIYLFGDQPLSYADAGDHDLTKTLKRVGSGCDSIVHLTLHVVPVCQNIEVSYEATIELGEQYLFIDTVMAPIAVGNYAAKRTIQRVGNDCDSTINLTLHVVPGCEDIEVSYEATIELGEQYLFIDTVMAPIAVGNYAAKRTIQRVGNDCDSTINLTLKVVPACQDIEVSYEATIELGEQYLFIDTVMAPIAVGNYAAKRTIKRVGSECDSIINLLLHVDPACEDIEVSYEATIKLGEQYLFIDTVMAPIAVGNFAAKRTIQRVGNDCDSTINLTLHVVPGCEDIEVSYEATIKLGEQYLFIDTIMAPTAIGNFAAKRTIQRVGNDCDSTINLTLHVVPACATPAIEDTAVIVCAGDLPFVWHGMNLYRDTVDCDDTLDIKTALGCDTIVRLKLTVQRLALDSTEIKYICPNSQYNWIVDGHDFGVKTEAAIYHDTIRYVNHDQGKDACDSAWYTLDLRFFEAKDSLENAVTCAGTPYKWIVNDVQVGEYSEAKDYQYTLKNQAGCDSIRFTLHLAVNPVTTGDTTAVECSAFTWYGKEYTASGDYTHMLTNVAGCDSTLTLHLTINKPSASDTTASECESFTWYGKTYTSSGDYTRTLENKAGCDSIITLHLTIRRASEKELTAEACDEYKWHGRTLTESGDYKEVLENAAGCDSIITLHLTINKSIVMEPEKVSECNMYTWRNTLYTRTGLYYDTLTTVAGCDSILVLDLKIATPYDTTLSLVHVYGDRLIMINRHEINAMPGWTLDSLDVEHPEYVIWYEVDPSGNQREVAKGYTYNLPNGEPLPAGYTYYAVIIIPATDGDCGAQGRTVSYTIPAHAGMPELVPSLAQPGQDIRVTNLDPEQRTTIRVYTTEGVLQGTYTAEGETSYVIKAADGHGFYLVELSAEDMKSTLRYIVK